MQSTAAQWTQWQAKQHLIGPGAEPDSAGDSKILTPDQVPGAYFGSTETN